MKLTSEIHHSISAVVLGYMRQESQDARVADMKKILEEHFSFVELSDEAVTQIFTALGQLKSYFIMGVAETELVIRSDSPDLTAHMIICLYNASCRAEVIAEVCQEECDPVVKLHELVKQMHQSGTLKGLLANSLFKDGGEAQQVQQRAVLT